jgi:hypothetical protein
MIDTYCGRIDSFGGGSLVYSTYAERMYLPDQRNICRVSFTPLVALDTATSISLSGLSAVSGNHFYTGFQPNTTNLLTGDLSAIVGLSGRYSYGRRSANNYMSFGQYGPNLLQFTSLFGGVPSFTPIDISTTDYYADVGELAIPAGLYAAYYTEIIVIYNSGFSPLLLPKPLKHATAALVKNFIVRGGGITSVRSYTAGKIHTQFSEDLIDKNIQQFLRPFLRLVAI